MDGVGGGLAVQVYYHRYVKTGMAVVKIAYIF